MTVLCAKCGGGDVICYPILPRYLMVVLALWYRMTGWWRHDVPLCPKCCDGIDDGHDFAYERDAREWQCQHCGEPAPYDFWAYHPD